MSTGRVVALMGLIMAGVAVFLLSTSADAIREQGPAMGAQTASLLYLYGPLGLLGSGVLLMAAGAIVHRRNVSSENTQLHAAPKIKTNSGENSGVEAQLKSAKDMLDKGLIDEEEFKAMKKKIIDRT